MKNFQISRFRCFISSILIMSFFMVAAASVHAASATDGDKLVQCSNTGVVTDHNAITGTNFSIVFDTNPAYYPISTDVAVFAASTSVKALEGLTSTNLQIGLGSVVNYEYDTVYEIKYRGHYGIVGVGTEMTEEWKSSGLYFRVEADVSETEVVLQSAVADGSVGTATSTKIELTFDKGITGLTADDITITSGTGAAVKGVLTGSGTSWSLALTSVSAQGDVSVVVAAPAGYILSGSPKTVAVYKETEIIHATISPTTVIFDLDNPADVSTSITWGSAHSVTAVVYGSDSLVSPGDFIVNGNTLTIKESFLLRLDLSENESAFLEISFDQGDDATLTIEAVKSYVPGTDAALSNLTVSGSTVDGFEAGQFVYEIELPYGTQPGSGAALVGATPAAAPAAIVITQAGSLPGDATVSVTSEDTNSSLTYTIHFSVAEPPVPNYSLTITAGSGGSILAGSSGNYGEGTVITIEAYATGSYSFNKWISTGGGAFGNVNSSSTTFAMPAEAVTISASFTHTGGGSGIGGGEQPSETVKPETTLSEDGKTATTSSTAKAETDPTTGVAVAKVGTVIMTEFADKAQESESAGQKAVVEINVAAPADAENVEVELPREAFDSLAENTNANVRINVGLGTIVFNARAVDAISSSAAGGDISISIAEVDTSTLSKDMQNKIGDRPVYDFTVMAGSTEISKFGGGVAEISIPYTLKPGEKKNAIVIYYIDSKGKLQPVRGKYDPITGTVQFTTSHFSQYIVGYKDVIFSDVADKAWYSDAVNFIAARGITTGTGNGNYNPNAKLTRGEFLVMLMRAYNLDPVENPVDNFSDAGNTYYTGYLAAAKSLGITVGVGNNKYAPKKEITRQEMFALLYNALKAVGELPQGDTGKPLSSYSDAGQIASWAKEAMTLFVKTGTVSGSGGNLNPASATTRAEIAQILYNLLSK